MLAPHVTQADRPGKQGRIPGAGDAAGFIPVVQQVRSGRRRHGGGKLQLREPPVDVAARAHPLDDFLAGVASFFVVDVSVFEARLVRDLLVALVDAKPGCAQFQAQGVESFHSRGRSPNRADARRKVAPQIRKVLARHD